MPDVSIALSAKDNFSETLRKLASAASTSVNDVDALQKSLTKLNNTRANLKLDLSRAKSELREAEKRFKATGDAADELALKDKQIEFDNLTSQLKAVSSSAQAAEKNMMSLAGTNSKLSNRASGSGKSGSMWGTLGGALATAGFGDMLSGSLSQAAGAFLGSYYGASDGAAIESVLGGAISGGSMGASAGMMVAGPTGAAIGAAVGGAIGAVSGGIEAAAQKFTEKDEAFKSYVQESVEGVLDEQAQALTSGSAIAGTREMDQMAFATLFGSADIAKNYLEQVRIMGAKTPFQYDDLTQISRTLTSFGYSVDELIPTMTALGDAGAANGMTTDAINEMAQAIGYMRSSNLVYREQLGIFQRRGVDAVGAVAQAKGMSIGDVYSAITKGDLGGTEVANIITQYMQETYSGAMDLQSKTFEGLTSSLEDANAELQNAMGEGYNEARKAGLQEQLDWMNGEMGASMQQAYEQIGAFQASLENTREQMTRDAMNAVMTGVLPEEGFEAQIGRLQEMAEEYASAAQIAAAQPADSEAAQQAQADMGRLLAEAQVMAQNEYNASEGAQILLESQLSLAQTVAADTSADSTYYNAGQRLGQQYTQGISAAITSYRPPSVTLPSVSVAGGTTSRATGGSHLTGATSPYRAIGENRVPRDNTLYLLHEGERVLTAREARAADRKESGGNVVVNMGGSYTVRQDSDIDAIAEAVAARVLAAKRTLRPS